MYYDTQYDYKESVMRMSLENEMRRTMKKAMQTISQVAHFEQENLLKIIAHSFLEGNEHAENLAHKLNLGQLDFLAVVDNYDRFKEEYLKEQELNWAQNF